MMQITNESIKQGYLRRRVRFITITALLGILAIALCYAMVSYGNTKYPLDVIIKVINGENIKGATFAIKTIRLPRMICGALVGLAFGVAGNTFQTMLRNPLASPDIIGITSGSSVAAVFCILVLKFSGGIVSISAVGFGLLVSLAIYLLSKGLGFSGGRLILIGIGINAIINAVISFLLIRASQNDVAVAVRWLSGSLNGMVMENVQRLFIAVVIFVAIILMLTKYLQIIELGDEFAISLGVKVNIIRILLILSSVFLIAFATAVTGPISFVSFLAGPIASKLVGQGASRVVPSALVGAILVLGADLLGQFVFSTRFPVGVVTGMIGGPCMLFLLVSINKKGEL